MGSGKKEGRERVVWLVKSTASVSQYVSLWTQNEHFERIRNPCGFLLQRMSSKLKNNNLRTLHNEKSYEGCENQRFLLSVQMIELNHTRFQFFILATRKIARVKYRTATAKIPVCCLVRMENVH